MNAAGAVQGGGEDGGKIWAMSKNEEGVGKVRGSKRVWEGVVVGWSMAVVW